MKSAETRSFAFANTNWDKNVFCRPHTKAVLTSQRSDVNQATPNDNPRGGETFALTCWLACSSGDAVWPHSLPKNISVGPVRVRLDFVFLKSGPRLCGFIKSVFEKTVNSVLPEWLTELLVRQKVN